jgi:TonB family protein
MMRSMLLVSLLLALTPNPAAAQTRDTPPPAVEEARRERELRAAIDAGAAKKGVYIELATLMNRQNRFDAAIEALRGAAALEPMLAEPQHRIALLFWDKVRGDSSLDAAKRTSYIRQGVEAEDRALAMQPDYMEATRGKELLLSLQANPSADPFTGFSEPFEQTMARLQPVRVGGNVKVPAKTKDVKPVYPAIAQSARVQGVVIIEALIDDAGNVANARILRSIPLLDAAALGAVSQWQFAPAEIDGRKVAVVMTVTVNFTME